MTAEPLSQSELRYRRLFEAARDGILIVNPETRKIVDVNPFLAKFLGYETEHFIGKELFEIGLLKDEAASQAAFRELQESGYIRYDDLPLQTADGRKVDVEFVSNLYQEGSHQVIQCNIRDITARKRMETALIESDDRFQLVARAVSDAIWDWDISSGRLWWSDGFLTTFGYVAADVEPGIESWTTRIHPEDLRRVDDGIHRAIDSSASVWAMEYRFRCKAGHYAFVFDSGYIIRDASGKGVRMVGGMRDITEQKKMEAQYHQAQRMESIGTLAGGIAHDLNNMLTPIMMSVGLLQLDAEDDPGRTAILETIQASCHRGADLVRHVLSFARGLDGEKVTIRLRDLVDDLNGIISETFPRNIRIITQIYDDLWPVTGDPTQLNQVLLNLAVNARDAMPEGGKLTITASNTVLDAQHAGTSHEEATGRHVLLQVTDTGHGMSPETRERIFEPFFTTKEVGKGTGIGLATVHTIVKSHGGYVAVESELGKGTTFKVYLPAALCDQASEPLLPLTGTMSRGCDELILVVDDEYSIRDITRKTLEAFGFRVITACDGAEAIALYATHVQEIAVVVTDIMMPNMDGVTMIQVLKRINPAVRIIAVSGLEVTENVARATKAGVHDFLPKPYTSETLIDLLGVVIDRPASIEFGGGWRGDRVSHRRNPLQIRRPNGAIPAEAMDAK